MKIDHLNYLMELVRVIKRSPTIAEGLLWTELKNNKLSGLSFNRKHHLGRYVVDFYCEELKLVIVIEGGIHEKSDQKGYDYGRFEEFAMRGLRVLRIKHEEVINNMDGVLKKILEFRNV